MMRRAALLVLPLACTPAPIEATPPTQVNPAVTPGRPVDEHAPPPTAVPDRPSEPAPSDPGCWARTFGAAPAAEGMGPSLPGPVDDCDGCETLRAGPNAASLHPEVLRRLFAIQQSRPAPAIDEPVLWVNSGRREGNPSKSMHNQGLGVDVVVCGLDSPSTAALLRDVGFTCVIEYYDAEGQPCHMAHADLRGTSFATAAYAEGARKAGTCPQRATSRGEGCRGNAKEDWYYRGDG